MRYFRKNHSTKNNGARILAVLGVAAGIGALLFFLGKSLPGNISSPGSPVTQSTLLNSGATESVAPLTTNYENSTFKFSVSMPEDFTSQELPPDGSGAYTILLQNAHGDGIQILVTPDQSTAKTLTANDVRASIPDMQVTDDQIVEIGNEYTGVAFKSDNDAFGGESREVWFYFRGNLYQISTYARLDPLLKAMFATWKFY